MYKYNILYSEWLLDLWSDHIQPAVCSLLPSLLWASSAVDPAESDLGPGLTLLHHRSLMLLDCRGRKKVKKAYVVYLDFAWSSVHFQGDGENK